MLYKKEMLNELNMLSRRHNRSTVFSDFLILISTALSNAVDPFNYEQRECTYMRTIKKYTEDEVNMVVKLYGLLVKSLSEEPGDVLGELYMELGIGNVKIGQYFTPTSVSKLIAELTYTDIDKHINKKGYVTLSEPSCGSGNMIIAFALNMYNKGYSYQKELFVDATDIDLTAVMMCYIQLTLLGIPAIINHHNTLSSEKPKRECQWITFQYANFIINSDSNLVQRKIG